MLRVEPWLPKAFFAIVIAGALLSLWDWFLDRAAADRNRRARFYAAMATLMLATVVVAAVLLPADVEFGVFLVELALIVWLILRLP